MFRGSWHFHGHNHVREQNLDRASRKCFNVGVDAWDFAPVTFEQVQEKFENLGGLKID